MSWQEVNPFLSFCWFKLNGKGKKIFQLYGYCHASKWCAARSSWVRACAVMHTIHPHSPPLHKSQVPCGYKELRCHSPIAKYSPQKSKYT